MPDMIFINKGKLADIFGCIYLVLYFILTQLQVCFLFKCLTAKAGTCIVYRHNDKALLRQVLVPQVVFMHFVTCFLRTGSAVVAEKNRVFFRNIKMSRLDHKTIQRITFT